MKRRFQPEDDESVARQYAGNELYQSIRSISHLIEEKSAFAMSAEECFTEVTELLTLIAREREAILPRLETLLIEKHNEYKRLERHLSDDQIYQAVAIVFGYAMLALDSSHATFFRYTLPMRLCFTVTLRKFSGWTDLLAQIFNVDLPDGWFDRFIAEGGEDAGEMKVGEAPAAFDIISELQVIFHNNCEEAAAFIRRIDGAKSTFITEEVNRLLSEEKITKAGCKRDLWRILHDNGYYKPSESNWNRRVNA